MSKQQLFNVIFWGWLCAVNGFTTSVSSKDANKMCPATTQLPAVAPDVFLGGLTLAMGAMVALNKNPDVLDPVLQKSTSTPAKPTAAKKPTKVSSPAAKISVSPSKAQEDLTNRVKIMADDLASKKSSSSKLEKMMEDSRVNSIFTEPISDRIKQPIKRKPHFFRKLTKKTVMPWRQWVNL